MREKIARMAGDVPPAPCSSVLSLIGWLTLSLPTLNEGNPAPMPSVPRCRALFSARRKGDSRPMSRIELEDATKVGRAPVPSASELDGAGVTDPSIIVAGQMGELAPGAGARLLMDLFVKELTGRLV